MAYKQAKGLYWITFQRPTKDNCFSILAVSSAAQAEKPSFFRNPGRFRINLIKLNLNSQRKASKQSPPKKGNDLLGKKKFSMGTKLMEGQSFLLPIWEGDIFLCNTDWNNNNPGSSILNTLCIKWRTLVVINRLAFMSNSFGYCILQNLG